VQVGIAGEHSPGIRILFLASNPKDTPQLRLDEEMRAIDHALLQAEFRDRFDIKQHWAVRVIDVQGYLLRHKPDILHFSGHGSSSSEIILEDNVGNSRPVPPKALSQLFSVLKDNIRIVVLNACYSEQQAQSIAEHIDCVIGMSRSINDPSAIGFATAFYQALGYGRDVKTAFDLGCIQIGLDGIDEQSIPKLLALRCDPTSIVLCR
jgi:CHAT domain-containing protein